MSEFSSSSAKESVTPTPDQITDILDAAFEAYPDADWVALGLSSRTVFKAGKDAERPPEEEFSVWERQADEWLEIYGRPVLIDGQVQVIPES